MAPLVVATGSRELIAMAKTIREKLRSIITIGLPYERAMSHPKDSTTRYGGSFVRDMVRGPSSISD